MKLDGEAGSGADLAAGQDGEPDVCRVAEHDSEEDHLSAQHVYDGVDESGGAAEPWTAVSGGDGRDAGDLERRDGGVGDGIRREIQFTAAHGLSVGAGGDVFGRDAIRRGDSGCTTIFLNAPFTNLPEAGAVFGSTITYSLAESLGSVSMFDYWDPSSAVQRIVEGAAMDKMKVKVNGDFQEFDFSGPSRDLLDSASFHKRSRAG